MLTPRHSSANRSPGGAESLPSLVSQVIANTSRALATDRHRGAATNVFGATANCAIIRFQ
jgi:hypothetical protein